MTTTTPEASKASWKNYNYHDPDEDDSIDRQHDQQLQQKSSKNVEVPQSSQAETSQPGTTPVTVGDKDEDVQDGDESDLDSVSEEVHASERQTPSRIPGLSPDADKPLSKS